VWGLPKPFEKPGPLEVPFSRKRVRAPPLPIAMQTAVYARLSSIGKGRPLAALTHVVGGGANRPAKMVKAARLKKATTFVVDCSKPVDDKIMEIASFEKFLQVRRHHWGLAATGFNGAARQWAAGLLGA
jgi:hypothetical protein